MGRPILISVEQPSTAAELQDRLDCALRTGFDGIEVVLAESWGERFDGLDRQDSRDRTAPSVSGPIRNLSVDAVAVRCPGTDVDNAATEVTTLLRLAASYGARCLNLTIPPLAGVTGQEGFSSYQDGLNFAYQLLHRIRFEAERSGVVVALEAAANGCLLSPVELREIVDCANSWAVGACLNVNRIALFSSPADWITTLKHRLYAVRLSNEQLPHGLSAAKFEMDKDFGAVVDALEAIGYDRPLIASGSGNAYETGMWAGMLRGYHENV